MMFEAAKLAQSHGELQSFLGEMKNVARNNALLSVRIATNEQRIAEFDRELQSSPPPRQLQMTRPRSQPNRPHRPNLETLCQVRGDSLPSSANTANAALTNNKNTNRYEQTEILSATERQRAMPPDRTAHVPEQSRSGCED